MLMAPLALSRQLVAVAVIALLQLWHHWPQVAAADVAEEVCDGGLLVTAHKRMQDAVGDIAELHFNFTGARHYEVVEIISVFQADQLCRSALSVVESLRLASAILACPWRYTASGHSHMLATFGRPPMEVTLPDALRLQEHVEQYFVDIQHVASGGQPAEPGDSSWAAWEAAAHSVREVSTNLLGLVAYSLAGQRLDPSSYSEFEQLLGRISSTVVDFLRAMVTDLGTLYRVPNYVAEDMLPPRVAEQPSQASRPAPTTKLIVNARDGATFSPGFVELLRAAPGPLLQPSFYMHPECEGPLKHGGGSAALPLEYLDVPLHWAHRDVSGAFRRQPSPQQLLRVFAGHNRLSNLVLSLQLSAYIFATEPSCGATGLLFDPSYCLLEEKWGGYFFQINPLPPFNLTVVYSGKALGPGTEMPAVDIHSIHVDSREAQWSSLVSTFKSVNHHSPDLLYLSPFVGNCVLLDRVLGTGTVKPKLVYVPINPLIQPPTEEVPDFFQWWGEHLQEFVHQLTQGVASEEGGGALPMTTSVWLSQCSLVASNRIMHRHGYVLLHVEHTYATFVWRPLWKRVSGAQPGADAARSSDSSHGSPAAGKDLQRAGDVHSADLLAAWLDGWHCSPHARYLFDLEILTPSHVSVGMPPPAVADDGLPIALPLPLAGWDEAAGGSGASGVRELPWRLARRLAGMAVPVGPSARYFLERPCADGHPRGHCTEGVCECFPPYRGPLCQFVDAPRVRGELRAVIHYIVADNEEDISDLERSLTTLWQHFNQRHDYPVVVFHDGLTQRSRQRIVELSENRVWLVLLPNFRHMPPEWAAAAKQAASDFSLGYRAMIRWRSGPLFVEPALARFDYAMTLDTDSYFPAALAEDPFEFLHREGLVAVFPHLGRESASVVVNFMHYFLLYCRLQGLHPRRTKMLEALVEQNFKWYQQCMMLDIEIVRLDWFRGARYQDMFRYMDSTGGFWLHRWGNNPFRTFAVGLLLEDADVLHLQLPYAHQDFCSCGAGARPCAWDKDAKVYRCDDPAAPRAFATLSLEAGLLDLQPWRGSERQVQNFDAAQFRQFVEEHSSF